MLSLLGAIVNKVALHVCGQIFKKLFIYFWLCCVFLGAYSLAAVCRFLVVVASLAAEHGL